MGWGLGSSRLGRAGRLVAPPVLTPLAGPLLWINRLWRGRVIASMASGRPWAPRGARLRHEHRRERLQLAQLLGLCVGGLVKVALRVLLVLLLACGAGRARGMWG